MRIFKIANVVGGQMTTFALVLFFLFSGAQVNSFPEGVQAFLGSAFKWGTAGFISCGFFLLFATGYKIVKLAEDPEVDRMV